MPDGVGREVEWGLACGLYLGDTHKTSLRDLSVSFVLKCFNNKVLFVALPPMIFFYKKEFVLASDHASYVK